MDKSISLCIHLLILGVLACFTSAVSLRHKRNVIAEYKWPEPDPNIDQFPHESSCHHYYLVISEDDITVNRCPHGELFDYIEHQCKEKESAHCWSHHFGKPKHHHIVLKSKGSFTCPYAWGKYPDVNDCTKYYACLSGKVKHKKCAPFEHFDKISRKCVAMITGVCADETDVVERDFKCPKHWGSFSFRKDCSKYYECLDKQPNLRTCPTDTLFHEKRGKCVPRHHVHCGSRHNPYSKKGESSATKEGITSENLPPNFSEHRKSSIKNEDVLDVKKSTESKNVRKEEVESDNNVSQTPQPRKDAENIEKINSWFNSTSNEPEEINVESEHKTDVNVSPNVSQTSQKDAENIENINSGLNSTSNEPEKISVESEHKTNLNVSPKEDINEEDRPLIKVSQTPNEMTAVEISNGSSSTPQEIKSNVTVSTSKDLASNETESLVEHSTLKSNLNDTDEIPDSLNTNEFIEVSTDSEASISTTQKTITVGSTQQTEASSTGDKQDQQTTLESSQATPLDECDPKDFKCHIDEEGRVIRCPKPDGLFPYPWNERRFLECKKSEIRIKFCPGNMIYSHPSKKCISKMIF